MNLVGWGVTGLVLFLLLAKLATEPRGDLRFALGVYAVNFALPFGFCVLNQYWLAVFAGAASIAIVFLVFARKQIGSSAGTLNKLSPTSHAAGALSSRRHG
jgi:hypothetical protein